LDNIEALSSGYRPGDEVHCPHSGWARPIFAEIKADIAVLAAPVRRIRQRSSKRFLGLETRMANLEAHMGNVETVLGEHTKLWNSIRSCWRRNSASSRKA